MNVDDLAWPVMVLGVMGVPFTIESPDELRDRVRSAGETLLRAVPSRGLPTRPAGLLRIGAPVAPIPTKNVSMPYDKIRPDLSRSLYKI
jgi:hypothetical protein